MAIVYWLHAYSDTDPLTEGYIGVASNLCRRLNDHYRMAKRGTHQNPKLQELLVSGHEILTIIMESGTYEDCLNREKRLRPTCGIGLNQAAGGKGGPTRIGHKMSEEFRQKRREYMLGNSIARSLVGKPKSEEHRRKISESNSGKPVSDERRLKQSLAMKGRTLSSEHRKKIGDGVRKSLDVSGA